MTEARATFRRLWRELSGEDENLEWEVGVAVGGEDRDTRQDRSESCSQLFSCVASTAPEVLVLSQWLKTLSSLPAPTLQSYDPMNWFHVFHKQSSTLTARSRPSRHKGTDVG